MAEDKSMSPEKARKILEDGTVYGKPLTPKQRVMFTHIRDGVEHESSDEGEKKADDGDHWSKHADTKGGKKPDEKVPGFVPFKKGVKPTFKKGVNPELGRADGGQLRQFSKRK